MFDIKSLLVAAAIFSPLVSATAIPPVSCTDATYDAQATGIAARDSDVAAMSSAIVPGLRNAVYFTNWGIYGRNYQPADLPAASLTHVLYAFANIQADGTVVLSDTYADLQKHYAADSWNDVGNNVYGCVKQLFLLKKANRNMKTLLSIGGWTYSTNFPAAASTAATRTQFANTAVQFVQDLGFDGIDIDWEYPASATDAANFVLLLAAVRQALDTYSAAHAGGYHFLITIASPAGPANYNQLQMSAMDTYLDAWHMMAYDYSGSWDTLAGNDANLYASTANPSSTPYSTDAAVKAYIAGGVTASKIVIGMPLYGRSFEATAGLGQPFTGVGSGSWENGIWDFKVLPKSGATEYYDAASGATWSYDATAKELISYDTVAMAKIKAQYIQSKSLGGAMYWEASGDRTGTSSIMLGVAGTFGSLQQVNNCISYPASQYANMVSGM